MGAAAARTGMDMADVNDLAPLSQRLNAATDELNQVLGAIQDKLNALQLGVEAYLSTPLSCRITEWDRTGEERTSEERTSEELELGYARHGDGWAFVVRMVRYGQTRGYDRNGNAEWQYIDPVLPVVVDTKPLLKAARHVRVAAVPLIPKLVEQLKAEAAKVIDAVEQARKIAESLK